MFYVFAQSITLTDVPWIQKLLDRLDLVGVLVLFCYLIYKKIFVPGWALEASEKRNAELEKINGRLNEIAIKSIETTIETTRRAAS